MTTKGKMAYLALGGFVLMLVGLWLAYPPAAVIVGGGVVAALSFCVFVSERERVRLRRR